MPTMPRRPSRGPSIVRRSDNGENQLRRSQQRRDEDDDGSDDHHDDGHRFFPSGTKANNNGSKDMKNNRRGGIGKGSKSNRFFPDEGDTDVGNPHRKLNDDTAVELWLTRGKEEQEKEEKKSHPSKMTSPTPQPSSSSSQRMKANHGANHKNTAKRPTSKKPTLRSATRQSIMTRGQRLLKDSRQRSSSSLTVGSKKADDDNSAIQPRKATNQQQQPKQTVVKPPVFKTNSSREQVPGTKNMTTHVSKDATQNNAKWSRPQPPPSNKSVTQHKNKLKPVHPQPPRQSVSNRVNSNKKAFVFENAQADESLNTKNDPKTKNHNQHHHQSRDDDDDEERIGVPNNEGPNNSRRDRTTFGRKTSKLTQRLARRPSTATPQVAQMKQSTHDTHPLNKEIIDDSDLPPPPPSKPTRPPVSPMSNRSPNRRSKQQEQQQDQRQQSQLQQKITTTSQDLRSPSSPGQFDDASEKYRHNSEHQFEDASEAPPPADVPYGQFEDASEHTSSRRQLGGEYRDHYDGQSSTGQFDDASERTGSNSLHHRRPPSGRMSTQADAFGGIQSSPSSSSQRKKTMGFAKAALLKGALNRVRSRTSDKKEIEMSRDSSNVGSVASFSPFNRRKKGNTAAQNSPANDTHYSGSTITTVSGTTSRSVSDHPSEKTMRAIEGVVSNAETEKTRNLAADKVVYNPPRTKGSKVPQVIRHSAGKQQTHKEGRSHQRSSATVGDHTHQIPSSSAPSIASEYSDDEYESRTERSFRDNKSGQLQSDQRQSDTTVYTTISGGKAISSLSKIPKSNRIRLHVYDLVSRDTRLDLWGCHFPLGQCFNAVNSSLHSIGTGAYHVGVEVNGIEYAYGQNGTKGLTGVFTCMPKSSPGYQYRTTIDFGDRRNSSLSQSSSSSKSHVDGREVVREMAAQYMGTDYDLLRKNCCTFAHDACVRLGIDEKEIPSWFHNLAATGAMTQDAVAPLSSVLNACELDRLTNYINEGTFDNGFEVIESTTEKGREEKIVDSTH